MTDGDILIIDDVYEDIVILETLLTSAGFSVRAARDGASGLRAAKAKPPDVLLLDLILPDTDGFEICDQFRESETLRNVPIIFVSALEDMALKAQAFESGASDYVTKPFEAAEILIRVHHQFERLALRGQQQEAARLLERQHIARELHDSVSQTLFILNASLQSVLSHRSDISPDARDELGAVNDLARSAQAEMRMLLNELRPAAILQAPIQKLLYQLSDAFRLRLNADFSVFAMDVDVPPGVKLEFYRIAQEAVSNIAKYADAKHVSIRFIVDGSRHLLRIEDDGIGFDPDATTEGLGLSSMRERAQSVHLELSIVSSPGAGTLIEAAWDASSDALRPGA